MDYHLQLVTPDLASLAATSTGELLAGWTQEFTPPHGGYVNAKDLRLDRLD